MWEESITLEHRVYRAEVWGKVSYVFSIDKDLSGVGRTETGKKSEQGGLTAA